MPLRGYRLGTVSAVMLAVSHVASGAQSMPVEAVLAQVARHVDEFIPRFANVVSVETYEQRTTTLVGAFNPRIGW